MRPFQAVIFDLDGTLLDTERLIIDAALSVLEARGHAVSRDFIVGLVGTADSEGIRRLGDHIGPAFDGDTFDADWSRAARTAYAGGIPLMAGVAELLDHLHRRDIPRAVGTNSLTASALRKLGQAGIAARFDPAHVVGYDAVGRPKPAPDVFLEAARRLGADPARCVVFEDSDPGVAAALAAGMTVVQIPDMKPPATRDAHHLAATMIEGARWAGLLG
ncbi:MAG: HAD family phosphatase [Rhodobacteraceae bacterium]|nr:HAD family phosphatase [Paracoccaceae bacterium]